MDSSLIDLEKKGLLSSAPETYNPGRTFGKVIHFTPHQADLKLQPAFNEWEIRLEWYPAVGLRPIRFLASLIKILRIVRREKVKIMRARLPYMGGLLATVVGRLLNIPSVVSLGGDNRIGQEKAGVYYLKWRWISFGLERFVLLLADRVIVPNMFTKHYVASIIGKKRAGKKCSVVPWRTEVVSEVGENDEFVINRLGLNARPPLVLIIGFLNRYKYSDVLYDVVESMEKMEWDRGSATFCFCGDGSLREEGERRFSHRRDVKFLGWQERSAVHVLIRRADVILIPMSGYVLLEAASIGKVVITSSVEWHEELVRSGINGYVVDPDNAQAWSDALIDALSDKEGSAQKGRALKSSFWKNYSPNMALEKEINVYQEVLGRRTAR